MTESISDILIRTDRCPRCGHRDEAHRYNRCQPGCDCFISGSEGREAAALWNAYLGRGEAVRRG